MRSDGFLVFVGEAHESSSTNIGVRAGGGPSALVCALADSTLPLPSRALVVAALNAFLLPTQDAVEVPASPELYCDRLNLQALVPCG